MLVQPSVQIAASRDLTLFVMGKANFNELVLKPKQLRDRLVFMTYCPTGYQLHSHETGYVDPEDPFQPIYGNVPGHLRQLLRGKSISGECGRPPPERSQPLWASIATDNLRQLLGG